MKVKNCARVEFVIIHLKVDQNSVALIYFEVNSYNLLIKNQYHHDHHGYGHYIIHQQVLLIG